MVSRKLVVGGVAGSGIAVATVLLLLQFLTSNGMVWSDYKTEIPCVDSCNFTVCGYNDNKDGLDWNIDFGQKPLLFTGNYGVLNVWRMDARYKDPYDANTPFANLKDRNNIMDFPYHKKRCMRLEIENLENKDLTFTFNPTITLKGGLTADLITKRTFRTVNWSESEDVYVWNSKCNWILGNGTWQGCNEFSHIRVLNYSKQELTKEWQVLNISGKTLVVPDSLHVWCSQDIDKKTVTCVSTWDGSGKNGGKVLPGMSYFTLDYNSGLSVESKDYFKKDFDGYYVKDVVAVTK